MKTIDVLVMGLRRMKRYIVVAIALSTPLATGCGSIHMFEETHTHIEKRVVLSTDDATVSMLVSMINRCRAASEPQDEAMNGFEWDEKILSKHKGDTNDE